MRELAPVRPRMTVLWTRYPFLSNRGLGPRKSTVPRSFWIKSVPAECRFRGGVLPGPSAPSRHPGEAEGSLAKGCHPPPVLPQGSANSIPCRTEQAAERVRTWRRLPGRAVCGDSCSIYGNWMDGSSSSAVYGASWTGSTCSGSLVLACLHARWTIAAPAAAQRSKKARGASAPLA